MRTTQQNIGVGDAVRYAGETWTVLALIGATALQMRSRSSRAVRSILIESLIEDSDFGLLTEILDAEICAESNGTGVGEATSRPQREGAVALFDELTPEVRRVVLARERLILTMLTGYPDGGPSEGRAPDPEYAACSSMAEKYATLAARANAGNRTVRRWLADYAAYGIAGLADVRHLRVNKGLSNIDPTVQECMIAALSQLGHESKVTNVTLRKRVEAMLVERHEQGAAACPSQNTFNRYLAQLREASTRHLSTKTQQGAKNAPQGVHLVMPVTRPFEYTLWDSTPLDLLTFDPSTGKSARVWLTIVLDLFSRSIAGWLFTSEVPTAADMSRLLYRVATPKPMLPHWPEHARWRYPAVPEWLATEGPHPARGCGDGIAGIPFGLSETVVIDHGRTFKNLTFREAARILRSNLQLCRVLTPTDKAHVEAVFGRIREQFVQHYPAYVGPDLASRGDKEHVDDRAHVFLWELDDDFAEWVACDYQTQTHRGLVTIAHPKLELSPNEMLDFGWTRAGFIRVPPDRQLLIDLLPTRWRTVQAYGVEIDVRFDAAPGQEDVLAPYRNRKSPFRSVTDERGVKADGKWKIKIDPSIGKVWFWACELDDPTRGTYVPLYYRGQPQSAPFSDKMVAYSKQVLIGRGGNARDPEQVMDTLDRITSRIRSEQALPVAERRLAARLAVTAYMTGKDFAAAGIDLHTGAGTPAAGPTTTFNETSEPWESTLGVVDQEEQASRYTYDPSDVELLPTADVTEIDFFGGFEATDGDADLGGLEDLAREDES